MKNKKREVVTVTGAVIGGDSPQVIVRVGERQVVAFGFRFSYWGHMAKFQGWDRARCQMELEEFDRHGRAPGAKAPRALLDGDVVDVTLWEEESHPDGEWMEVVFLHKEGEPPAKG